TRTAVNTRFRRVTWYCSARYVPNMSGESSVYPRGQYHGVASPLRPHRGVASRCGRAFGGERQSWDYELTVRWTPGWSSGSARLDLDGLAAGVQLLAVLERACRIETLGPFFRRTGLFLHTTAAGERTLCSTVGRLAHRR